MTKNIKNETVTSSNLQICLMGASPETGNLGVSALSASLVSIIDSLIPGAKIFMFLGMKQGKSLIMKTPKKDITVDIVNYRRSPSSRFHEHIITIMFLAIFYRMIPIGLLRKAIVRNNKAIAMFEKTDLVGEIRGGDSFSDIYGLKRMILGSIPAFIAILMDRPLVLMPQTYGPYQSKLARMIASRIMRSSVFILSRDAEGICVVNQLLGNRKVAIPVILCPDVAFTLGARLPQDLRITPPLPDRKKDEPLLGLNVNGLLFNGGYTRANMFGLLFNYHEFVQKLVDRILKSTEWRILLIPHTYGGEGHVESDPDACRKIRDSVPQSDADRVHMVDYYYDQFQIKGIVNLCDFFVGSRMHACIAALSQGIPTVGVSYSKKFFGVFDSVGKGNMVIDARNVEETEAVDMILSKLSSCKQTSIDKTGEIEIARNQIYKSFKTMISCAIR
ncbi:MAG TPA: polysaccharide pyruvyl transferase family protein [Candidatus Deferrimicrobiaceae bacterium]|jgi:polysaccharide pyruvyl transferase WcaK-like protein